MTTNLCGSCTMCCRPYAVADVKPANQWCQHCAIGKGCKIYDARPPACVTFECLWLQSQGKPAQMEPELRPDRCKVLFAPSTNERVMTAIVPAHQPDLWKKPTVMKIIRWLNRAGIGVAIGTPSAETQLVIEPDGRQHTVRMTPPDKDGMQWSITGAG